jgi:hypothetical protein
MAKNTRSNWVTAEEKLPAPGIDSPPLDAKPLGDLAQARPERPITPSPVPPAPMAAPVAPAPMAPAPKPPVPPTPMTEKEVSDALETSAKSLLDAVLASEKAKVAIAKICAMGSTTPKDRAIVSKSERLVVQIEKVKGALDMLVKEVEDYRGAVPDISGAPEKAPSDWLA